MKKTLRELEPEILKVIQEVGISSSVLSKRMYPNEHESKATNRLKGKLYGTGTMTETDLHLLKDALLGLADEIAVCGKALEKRLVRKQKIESLDLTDAEIEAIEKMRKAKE